MLKIVTGCFRSAPLDNSIIPEHLPPSSLRKASFEIMDVKDQIPRQPQCYWITILGSWRRDDGVSTTERTHGPTSTLKGIILAVTVMYYILRV